MSRRLPLRRLMLLGLAMLASHSLAELRPTPGSESIDELFASSDMVLRGEVKEIQAKRRVSGTWQSVPTILTTYTARVAADKVYKGLATSVVSVEYVRPEERLCAVSTCIGLEVGEFDYFFLSGSGGGYELRDPYFGKFRASHRTESRESAGVEGLKRDFVSGLQDPDEHVRLMQVELVGSSGRKADAEHLKRQLASSDDLTRATIYYALLRLGDYSTLAAMRGFLEVPSRAPAVAWPRGLCLAEINAISDAAAVDSLVELAKSPADDVREAAIHALRTIRSARTVPLFVHALDDHVQMVRYNAVLALAEIEQNWQLAPAVDTFRANETKYISAWKLWWEREGKQKYEGRTSPASLPKS